MFLLKLVVLLQILSLVKAAVLHSIRQISSNDTSANLACPLTLIQWRPQAAPVAATTTVTQFITITDTPAVVTIALPNYEEINRSLSSASTVESVYVVHQSQDRPVLNPPDTSIPTFVHSIYAPAFEASEVPSVGEGPVVYTPEDQDLSDGVDVLPSPVVISVTTFSFTHSSSTSQSSPQGTANLARAVMTAAPAPIVLENVIAAHQMRDVEKRQTCVLISAYIGGAWASWCNNWPVAYSTWVTTVTPGVAASTTTSQPSQPQVASSQTGPSTALAQSASSLPVPGGAPPVGGCGEQGNFQVSFDNLPTQSASNGTAGLPPIFNPFDHFYWDETWSYVPPPPAPYSPQAGDQLAICTPPPNQTEPEMSLAGTIPTGGFGAGPRDRISAYWFNAFSGFFGCDVGLSDPSGQCDFVAQGYRLDPVTLKSELHVTQHFYQPLCTAPPCQLQAITFNDHFSGITALSFYALAGGQHRTFYMDTLNLAWWNNTCGAGLLRASSRK